MATSDTDTTYTKANMARQHPDDRVCIRDEQAMLRLARDLWPLCRTGDVIALWGDLGAGKTSFARGFIRAATHPAAEVPSPTFTLLQTYEAGDRTIYHFDLYRLELPDHAMELGVEDAFADGISLIEWPGNMAHYLPANRLDIEIDIPDGNTGQDTGRMVTLTAPSGSWSERLSRLKLPEREGCHEHLQTG